MISIAAPLPEPDLDRINWLISRISMLEAGASRRPYIAELSAFLAPWVNHWAGGIADAEDRLGRLRALGSRFGPEFNEKEVAAHIKAALALMPPSKIRLRS